MKQYKYQEITKEDWIKTTIYIAIFIAVITIGAIFLLPADLYVWFIILAGSLFLLVRWHAKNFAYRCFKCGNEFEISIFTDFISPHGLGKGGGWKYLKCPRCHQRSKAIIIKRNLKL